MARMLLMRHGQTAASARGIYSSRPDIPLTDVGRGQAERAAELLRDSGVDAIRCSPFDRARETAGAVSRLIGVPVLLDERLREVDYGPLDGLDRAGAEAKFGATYVNWRSRPFGAEPPGMEPLGEALARARAAAEDAAAASACPLLVAHQGILRLVLVGLGRIGRDQYFATRIEEARPFEVPLHGAGVGGLPPGKNPIE